MATIDFELKKQTSTHYSVHYCGEYVGTIVDRNHDPEHYDWMFWPEWDDNLRISHPDQTELLRVVEVFTSI